MPVDDEAPVGRDGVEAGGGPDDPGVARRGARRCGAGTSRPIPPAGPCGGGIGGGGGGELLGCDLDAGLAGLRREAVEVVVSVVPCIQI